MSKMCGAALLVAVGVWAIGFYFRQYNRREDMLREWIAALEQLVTDIRWQHRRLPDIFRSLSESPFCGGIFGQLYEDAREGNDLYNGWHSAISSLPEDLKGVLRDIHLSGDEKHLTDSVLYAVHRFKELLRETEHKRTEKGKVFAAFICCGVGLLIIILL